MSQPSVSSASRSLPPFVRRFLHTEAAGGAVLVVAAIVALVWANSPWRDTYETLWHTHVTLKIGTLGFEGDLHHFVNDALMAVFFLVVGLEIKRELVIGDLREPRVAALPALAAVGGMVLPAALFYAVNSGGPGSHGWGIPMATDIAFALGVVALLGRRVPPAAKLFLLTLAIVDDIGAIVVIAVFYSSGIELTALGIAGVAVVAAIGLRAARVYWMPLVVVLGAVCWLALFESGVHATIAGVVFGLLAPARPITPGAIAARWTQDMSDEPSVAEIRALTSIARESVSSAERLEKKLHPLSSFVIVPIFALANAGVELRADALEGVGATEVALGVALGLVVGKLVGIVGATWLAVRLRVGVLPEGANWSTIAGMASVAGIGFTVSLFVTELAFHEPELVAASKIAILAASLVASVLGVAIVLLGRRPRPRPR